jgi:hypothetical protein
VGIRAAPSASRVRLLITHQTNSIRFNQLDRQRLKRMRYEGTEQTIPQEVNAA